jgi:hypothetical protein
MPHGLIIRMTIEVLRDQFGWNRARIAQETSDALSALKSFLRACRRQDFNAITGRDDQSFAYHLAVNERAQTGGARFIRESEPLAHRNRRGFVIESDEYDGHKRSNQ